MSRPDDHHDPRGREAAGHLWFTCAQAAAFVGYDRQTIYSWERRGLLTDPKRDERGRRIYTQKQISDAYRAAEANAKRTRRVAA